MANYDYTKTLWFLCMEMIDAVFELSHDEGLCKYYRSRADAAYQYDEERRKQSEQEYYGSAYYAERGV